mgnify:CR=1 FL=1
MPDKIKSINLLQVDHNAFKKLSKGEPAVVPIMLDSICVGDNYIVTNPTRPWEVTDVGASVEEILYVEYPPEGCTTYNGYPCGVGRHTPVGRIISKLAVLYPVVKEARAAAASSVEVVTRWKKSLELQAQLLRVTSYDFGNVTPNKRIRPSFNGKSLDEDEFCALDEKEQIACLEQLSRAILDKSVSYLNKISSAKSALE